MTDLDEMRVEGDDPGETFKHWMANEVKLFRNRQQDLGIQVPGVAVAVYGPAGGSWFHFGRLQDDPTSPLVTKDTLFAVGSVTKVFTAVLLALKVQNGDLSLNDVITVPGVPTPVGDLGQVTYLQLATHTSGMLDHQFAHLGEHISTNVFSGKSPSPNLQAAWTSWTNGCQAPIGTSWNYSNAGFVTLAYAIADGPTTYPNLLKQQITGPLEMNGTLLGAGGLPDPLPPPYSLATGYVIRDNQLKPVAGPASDLYTTAADMLTWLKANLIVLPNLPPDLNKSLGMAQANMAAQPYFLCSNNQACCPGQKQTPCFNITLANKIVTSYWAAAYATQGWRK